MFAGRPAYRFGNDVLGHVGRWWFMPTMGRCKTDAQTNWRFALQLIGRQSTNIVRVQEVTEVEQWTIQGPFPVYTKSPMSYPQQQPGAAERCSTDHRKVTNRLLTGSKAKEESYGYGPPSPGEPADIFWPSASTTVRADAILAPSQAA